MEQKTEQTNLQTLNLRIDKEKAEAIGLQPIELNPYFQRNFEAWSLKMKVRFMEAVLSERVINPIWVVLNPEDGSQAVLDGKHRISTAVEYLNNGFQLIGKYLMYPENKLLYDKKSFKHLTADQQSSIRNYTFMINRLDSSFYTDINKLQEMWGTLNRSTITLNVYEYNKILYHGFYILIAEYKIHFSSFIIKTDLRGKVDQEIITFYALSSEMPDTWSSIDALTASFQKRTIGDTQEQVQEFLDNHSHEVKEKLDFIVKVMQRLQRANLFSSDKKNFRANYIIYKLIICRLSYYFIRQPIFYDNVIELIINQLQTEIINVDLQTILGCPNRNATFQRLAKNKIDTIIKDYLPNNV